MPSKGVSKDILQFASWLSECTLHGACRGSGDTGIPDPRLIPIPFSREGGREKRAWYPLFVHVQDFLGIPRNSILQAYSKRHLEVELHCSSLWVWLRQRVMAASTECSASSAAIAFSLGKLGLSHISLKKEQRSAILAEYQGGGG